MQNNNGDYGQGFQNPGTGMPPGGLGQPTGPRVILESCYNLRRLAREALKGHWKQATLCCFLLMCLMTIPGLLLDYFFGVDFRIPVEASVDSTAVDGDFVMTEELIVHLSPASGLYLLLVSGALSFGSCKFFLRLLRSRDEQLGDLFGGFDYYGRTTGLFLWMCLFLILWALIPLAGPVLVIIAGLRYSMSFLVQVDDPALPIPECVRRSKYLMQGNKGKFFLLNLTFLGWILLSAVPAMLLGAIVELGHLGFPGTVAVLLLSNLCGAVVYAYLYSAQVVFYDMLTGRIHGESYQPGVY